MFTKRLRLWCTAALGAASLVLAGGAVAASATTGAAPAAHHSLMKADGFVAAQGSKASPVCALPQVCYSPALLQEAV